MLLKRGSKPVLFNSHKGHKQSKRMVHKLCVYVHKLEIFPNFSHDSAKYRGGGFCTRFPGQLQV